MEPEEESYCCYCGGIFTPDMDEEACSLCEETYCDECGTKELLENMYGGLCCGCYNERNQLERN